jgi:hypothetical protein
VTDYCRDFTGKVMRDPAVGGATFKWTVTKEAGNAWNEAILIVTMDDPSVPVKLGRRAGEKITFNLNFTDLAKTSVFDSPDCGSSG